MPKSAEKTAKIAELPPNFLQSKAWAKMNELVGREVIWDEDTLMIVKNARRGRYLEVPGGPTLNWKNRTETERKFQKIAEIAKSRRCVFVRLRPQLLKTEKNLKILENLGLKPAPMHLHAEHTVIIDLEKSEDDLLKNMRRQTRYEVRRSQKQGIVVEKGNSEALFREFHAVQTATAKRQHFIPPSLAELLAEREAFGDDAAIYVAKTGATSEKSGAKAPDTPENAPIAYGLILKSGAEAAYFEAASTELNRKLPGAYALQWQVIRDLKQAGVKRYNLWGIAPAGAKNHRYSGVTTFKTGFGGEIVEFVPAQDLIIRPLKYEKVKIIETVRKKRRHL